MQRVVAYQEMCQRALTPRMGKPIPTGKLPSHRVKWEMTIKGGSQEETYWRHIEANGEECGCLSLMPAEMNKRHLDDPAIGQILQWVESGTRPFGPEVCTASAATRHY